MDEFLFISMAKLDADRVRKERQDRIGRPPQTLRVSKPEPVSTGGQVHSLGYPQLPVVALVLAIILTAVLAAAVSDWYGAAYGKVPNGEVYITELSAAAASDMKVAQRCHCISHTI